VLVHGVAFGPETMSALARELASRARVLLVHRRGYGASAARTIVDVAGQVRDIIEMLDRHEIDRAVVAGVSGGATITIALAMAAPERIVAAIAHEPALGPRAPGVHGLLGVAAGALAQSADPAEAAASFARVLAGPTWGRLSAQQRERVTSRAEIIAREVPHFIAFAPSAADVRGLRAVRLVTSVGGLSPAQRHDAAAMLADHAQAEIAGVPGVAHLVQIDAPVEFARLVLRAAGSSR
jgi:pimeloyl-ACP methyl ester carboxylesterase